MKMTLEQHRELGERINEFREVLMQPHVICIGTKQSRENLAVKRAIRGIDHLKYALDFVVCNDCHDCEDAQRIYFPTVPRL